MRYVIVDLEATCWENGNRPDRMKIIEIGALLLESSSGPVSKEFASFVKPVASQELSDFCMQLTFIRQEDIDQAENFWAVFPRFVDWIGESPFRLCSWGAYDLNQLRLDCLRHKLALPASFENHINLKKEFSRLNDVKPMGMKGALAIMSSIRQQHNRSCDALRAG